MGWYRDVYLKSEDWKNLRAAILHDRDYKCELCGATKNIDVHHRKYRNIWGVLPRDLMALCRTCHINTHNKKDNLPKRVKRAFDRLQFLQARIQKHKSTHGRIHPNMLKGIEVLTKVISEA